MTILIIGKLFSSLHKVCALQLSHTTCELKKILWLFYQRAIERRRLFFFNFKPSSHIIIIKIGRNIMKICLIFHNHVRIYDEILRYSGMIVILWFSPRRCSWITPITRMLSTSVVNMSYCYYPTFPEFLFEIGVRYRLFIRTNTLIWLKLIVRFYNKECFYIFFFPLNDKRMTLRGLLNGHTSLYVS